MLLSLESPSALTKTTCQQTRLGRGLAPISTIPHAPLMAPVEFSPAWSSNSSSVVDTPHGRGALHALSNGTGMQLLLSRQDGVNGSYRNHPPKIDMAPPTIIVTCLLSVFSTNRFFLFRDASGHDAFTKPKVFHCWSSCCSSVCI